MSRSFSALSTFRSRMMFSCSVSAWLPRVGGVSGDLSGGKHALRRGRLALRRPLRPVRLVGVGLGGKAWHGRMRQRRRLPYTIGGGSAAPALLAYAAAGAHTCRYIISRKVRWASVEFWKASKIFFSATTFLVFFSTARKTTAYAPFPSLAWTSYFRSTCCGGQHETGEEEACGRARQAEHGEVAGVLPHKAGLRHTLSTSSTGSDIWLVTGALSALGSRAALLTDNLFCFNVIHHTKYGLNLEYKHKQPRRSLC
eukprot:scaffold7789_cov98-Isochrysis_galbana.AAC.1